MVRVVVVVVEDNDIWRDKLRLMYTRILFNDPNATDPHPDVKGYSTAVEAIQYFKSKSGERSNARPKVDVLSLDLNLGREGGATGIDVLNSAVNAGQKFVTIVVSGYATDEDLHEQMELDGKTSYLIELETRITAITKAKCLVHPKLKVSPKFPISAQAKALEKRLRSYVHGNSNVLRDWTESLRGTAADLNGKILCLHFELPKELIDGRNGSWVMGALDSSLNKISAWHNIFEKIDHTSTVSDLLTRLLFLITAKKNYQTGLSLRCISEVYDDAARKYSPPLPKKEWICPRTGIKSLSPRESFQLTQLVFQRMLTPNENSECKLSKAVYTDGEVDYKNIAAPASIPKFDLEVSGLLNDYKLTTPAGVSLSNGASLEVDRKKGAITKSGKLANKVVSTRSILNNKLREILCVDYDLVTAVDSPSETYKLQIAGCVYIQSET